MMVWRLVGILVLLAGLGWGGRAWAQQNQTQESDIQAALAKINGQDPIQRVLDTQAALQSPDQLLRSLALEKALQSDDGRVREVAFEYLMTVQKQFVVTISPPTDGSYSQLDQGTQNSIAHNSPLTLDITSMDTNTLILVARADNYEVSGAITQDGLSFLLPISQPLSVEAPNTSIQLPCQLQFRGFAGGMMRGALNCGPLSFPASTPLP